VIITKPLVGRYKSVLNNNEIIDIINDSVYVHSYKILQEIKYDTTIYKFYYKGDVVQNIKLNDFYLLYNVRDLEKNSKRSIDFFYEVFSLEPRKARISPDIESGEYDFVLQ
jgi:hypothetical protein